MKGFLPVSFIKGIGSMLEGQLRRFGIQMETSCETKSSLVH
jgi:hypothetical protein